MPRRAAAAEPLATVVLSITAAARYLGAPRSRVVEFVESDRLELHCDGGRCGVSLAALRALSEERAEPTALLRLFLLAGESWSDWCRAGEAVRREHARADRAYERRRVRRDRPAIGDGPRLVWLRTSGVCCAGCEAVLSSGRDQVRIASGGERWWLCPACGLASGAVDVPATSRRAG